MYSQILFKNIACIVIGVLFMTWGLTSCRQDSSTQHSRDAHPSLETIALPQGVDQETVAEMNAYLDAAHNYWNYHGSLIVAVDDNVILQRGIGMADMEKKVANTSSTKFLIGSITKTFTATAIMQLVENGLVDLDEPLVKYLPDYPKPASTTITVRHLLSHTSGIPDIAHDPEMLKKMSEPQRAEDLVALFKDKALDFKPGEKESYSNSGYILLGLIIKKVSGQPYSDYINDHILAPLEMKDSGTSKDYLSRSDFARGYIEKSDGNLMKAPYVDPSWGYSAGSLFSTVEDMFLLDQGLHSEKLLNRSRIDQMFSPEKGKFGFGWMVMEAFGKKSVCHGGGTPGFNAWIERWIDDRAFIAVFSNISSAPVGEIARSLAAMLFDKTYDPPIPRASLQVDPDLYQAYVGIYRINDEEHREVIREGDALMVSRNGGRRFHILPYARDCFFFPYDKGATLRFIRDPSGRITGQVFHQLGVDEEAVKISNEKGK